MAVVFEETFSMSRPTYEKIRDGMLRLENYYFVGRPDAIGKLGATTDERMTSAFRVGVRETSARKEMPDGRLSPNTNSLAVKRYC